MSYKRNIRYTDHKILPWSQNRRNLQKIYFTDYKEPKSDKTKSLIDKAIDLLKGLQNEHPVFSDILSVLLKIAGTIGVVSAGIETIKTLIYYKIGSTANANISEQDLSKLKEMVVKSENDLSKLKKESKMLGNMAEKSLKATLSPKAFLVKGLLISIGISLASYIAFASAQILKAKKIINESNY